MKTTIRPDLINRLINTGLLTIAAIILGYFTQWHWLTFAPFFLIALFNALAPRVSKVCIADGQLCVKKSKWLISSEKCYPLSELKAKTGRFSLDISKNSKEYLRIPPPRGHSKKHFTIYKGNEAVCTLIRDEEGWTSKRIAQVTAALQQRGVKVINE